MTIIRLENLLKSGASSRLDKIIQTAKDMESLTGALKEELGGELAGALISASVRDEELTLLCSSSAWAARLRFESDKLLAATKRCGVAVRRCHVKVTRQA